MTAARASQLRPSAAAAAAAAADAVNASALPNFRLGGRVALVTGASSGLGRHFAHTLAAAGAAVVVAARRADRRAALVGELGDAGGQAPAVALDVTDLASVRAAFHTLAAWRGMPDLLVNNAGAAVSRPLLEQSEADFDDVLQASLNRDFLAPPAGQRLMGRLPQQRFGTPADLDGALLLLAGDAGRFIADSVLVIDGGDLVSGL